MKGDNTRSLADPAHESLAYFTFYKLVVNQQTTKKKEQQQKTFNKTELIWTEFFMNKYVL